MKTKLLTLVALTAAVGSFALAQEVSPTPGEPLNLRGAEPSLRPDTTVSVPTESAPKQYPRPGTPLATPKSKAAPKKLAAPSPTPAPRATPSAKKTKPKAASSPAASSAAKAKPKAAKTPAASSAAKPKAQAAKPSVAKKDLPTDARALENAWAAATSRHDLATIESLIASDYVGVTSSGNVVNKAGLIAELKKDKNEYSSVTNSQLNVRTYGDTAVVIGATKQKGKDAAGKTFSYSNRWTDTWVKRDGRWQCVASQSSRWRK